MIYLVAILAYLVGLAVLAMTRTSKVKTEDDFAVAGRTLSPWIMVCTMLAVWIGTGSIVGNAEKTYKTGMAALMLPSGTFIGMILLALIAAKARRIEASSVPEIIGGRFGQTARALAVVSLIIAYMVIVSYQFNAGGAVLEVITAPPPKPLQPGDGVSGRDIERGWLVYIPRPKDSAPGSSDAAGNSQTDLDDALTLQAGSDMKVPWRVRIVEPTAKSDSKTLPATAEQGPIVARGAAVAVAPAGVDPAETYRLTQTPQHGRLELRRRLVTAKTGTIIAAVFIILFTMLAGLMSLAYMDIVTGVIIMVTMVITLPIYWFQAGGGSGMREAFIAQGRPTHMQFWGVWSATDIINFCLPVFLLVLGDANQYQRIFASRNARGATSAVTVMIFAALAIELLIIACAWTASSMTPDAENGKYILIYAARHYLPLPLGCLFMVTVVGIITSTANSFLLVPATTFIKDVYLNYINPRADEKHTIFLSRLLVVVFGVIAYLVSLVFAESTGFFEKALYAFTIYGASITPSLVAAITWQRATRAGAIASILSGTVVALCWSERFFLRFILPKAQYEALAQWVVQNVPEPIRGLDAVLPAILISTLLLIVVSLLTGSKATRSGSATTNSGDVTDSKDSAPSA